MACGLCSSLLFSSLTLSLSLALLHIHRRGPCPVYPVLPYSGPLSMQVCIQFSLPSSVPCRERYIQGVGVGVGVGVHGRVSVSVCLSHSPFTPPPPPFSHIIPHICVMYAPTYLVSVYTYIQYLGRYLHYLYIYVCVIMMMKMETRLICPQQMWCHPCQQVDRLYKAMSSYLWLLVSLFWV